MRGALRDRLILLVLVLAALALTACGGGGKDEVISDGDEICREANDRLAELEEPESLSGLPGYAAEARPIVEEAVADLNDLDAPDTDRESFDEFVARSEELLEVLERLEGVDRNASDAELQELNDEINRISDESNAAAEEYGFRDCAEE